MIKKEMNHLEWEIIYWTEYLLFFKIAKIQLVTVIWKQSDELYVYNNENNLYLWMEQKRYLLRKCNYPRRNIIPRKKDSDMQIRWNVKSSSFEEQ